ncbi:HNH endonuclease [Erwinia papayae]|uniref:HNH endonuclease n=1 Tax=Erwinia papayae TaxID=206499 RepID=A0ABV3N3B0_9GAMM
MLSGAINNFNLIFILLSGGISMPKSRPLEERFWEKVEKFGNGACWLWNGATVSPTGGKHIKPQIYGKIAGPRTPSGRKIWSAHRLSWVFENGAIPPGKLVDHKCHNTLCVNPAHLRLVTPKQNSENRAGPATTRNSSGKRGVRWNAQVGKWHAYYSHNRQPHYVGLYDDLEEASEAARLARNRVFTHNDADRINDCGGRPSIPPQHGNTPG